VLAWKIIPDGGEELLRGIQFSDLNTAAFKNIVAASKDQNILAVQFIPQYFDCSLFQWLRGDHRWLPCPRLLFLRFRVNTFLKKT